MSVEIRAGNKLQFRYENDELKVNMTDQVVYISLAFTIC